MNTTTRPNRNSYGTITLTSKQISNELKRLRPKPSKWNILVFISIGVINFYLVWHYIPIEKILSYIYNLPELLEDYLPKVIWTILCVVLYIPFVIILMLSYFTLPLLHLLPTFYLKLWYEEGFKHRWISKEKKNQIGFWETELRAAHNFEEDTKNYIQMETEQGHSYWLLSKGVELETKLQAMLNRLGGKMKMTSTTGDGGVDLHGIFRGREVQIQCKGLAKNCGVGTIRDAAGVKSQSKQHMIVCCPIGFTKNSVIFASNSDIELWNADDLTRLAGTPDYD